MTFKVRNQRSLFLHVPRTGGTYIKTVFKTCGLVRKWTPIARRFLPANHTLLSHYESYRLADVRFIFAFVRHPVFYYESVWRWLHDNEPASLRVANRWKWHPHAKAAQLYSPDFNAWVSRMLEEYPSWVTRLFESYVGPPGGEFVHFIGRTRTLDQDLEQLFKYWDMEFVWKQNRTRIGFLKKRVISASFPLEWDLNLKEEVISQESEVLARFFSPETAARRFYRRIRVKSL